jgi:F-type H+-transporting ATPase subunit epsilon
MSMAPTFHLSVITPEHSFFEGEVEMLVLNTADGEVAIQAGHAPMVISTVEGELRLNQNGKARWAAASSGFATVTQDLVYLMLQTAEWPEEIDIKRAQRSENEARERMRQKRSMEEYHMARSMLSRAMTRLRVSSRRNINN